MQGHPSYLFLGKKVSGLSSSGIVTDSGGINGEVHIPVAEEVLVGLPRKQVVCESVHFGFVNLCLVQQLHEGPHGAVVDHALAQVGRGEAVLEEDAERAREVLVQVRVGVEG